MPQWSPPVMGGMTRPGRVRLGRLPPAAMEPARNGRDDSQPSWSYPSRSQPPQWSPPVMGGMTYRPIAVASVPEMPQWSPPVMGGMTRLARTGARRGGKAAMEPARNGRDDVRAAQPGRRARALAAMEPARNGRDDPSSRDCGGMWAFRRNGARP